VIENQFGRSDHDHLGKLVTCLAAFGAKSAVWIVVEARGEHGRTEVRPPRGGLKSAFHARGVRAASGRARGPHPWPLPLRKGEGETGTG
jgi:hypothetical protein